MTKTVVSELAALVLARANCIADGNTAWKQKHEVHIHALVANHLPSGSGWDMGTTIDLDRSTHDKLVFFGSFHHMDEHGGYFGWTDHTIIARPSFIEGVSLTVSGRNRNDIKDHLYDLFAMTLTTAL